MNVNFFNIFNLTVEHLNILFLIGMLITIFLFFYTIQLSKKITFLNQSIFSMKREIEQRENMIEHSIAKIAEGLPISLNPADREKKMITSIESLLNKFSIKLNKKMSESLKNEQNVWHEKFSILLTIFGKNEKDINDASDLVFQKDWISISKLRQKAQLLFKDMEEDSIFYRIQSLWLLSNLSIIEHQYSEAFRYIMTAIKICHDSPPVLPLSHKILWKIGENLIICIDSLDKNEQKYILKKFHITTQNILDLYQSIESIDGKIGVLQSLRLWHNHQKSFIM